MTIGPICNESNDFIIPIQYSYPGGFLDYICTYHPLLRYVPDYQAAIVSTAYQGFPIPSHVLNPLLMASEHFHLFESWKHLKDMNGPIDSMISDK